MVEGDGVGFECSRGVCAGADVVDVDLSRTCLEVMDVVEFDSWDDG